MSDALELLGVLLICAGVGMWTIPGGLIVAGVALLLYGLALDGVKLTIRRPRRRER